MSTSFCLTLVSHGWLPLHQRSQSIQLQRVHIFKTTTTTTKSKQKPEREKKDPMIIQSQRLSTQNPELHGNAQWLWSAQIKHIYSVFKAKKISKWPLISGPTAFLLIKAKCFMRATFPKKAWGWKRSSLALPMDMACKQLSCQLPGCAEWVLVWDQRSEKVPRRWHRSGEGCRAPNWPNPYSTLL